MIPHKANEKNKPAFFARVLYKARARIEQGVGRAQALQEAGRATLRKDRPKLQINRSASPQAFCLMKFVHTA